MSSEITALTATLPPPSLMTTNDFADLQYIVRLLDAIAANADAASLANIRSVKEWFTIYYVACPCCFGKGVLDVEGTPALECDECLSD